MGALSPSLREKEAAERQPAALSCGVASIAFVLPGAPPKRAALCAERGSAPVKRKLERQARRCGLSLSGYLRRVGTGKPAAAFPRQRFQTLYQQVNVLRDNLTTQPMERTAAQLDELAGLILTAYTSEETDDGSN